MSNIKYQIYLSALILLSIPLAACNYPGLADKSLPTSGVVLVTATFQPSPTVTLTPTITPTPAPTFSPNAISIQTAELVQAELWLGGDNGRVYGVGVSPDGSLIASGGIDWIVRVFDGHSGELLHEMERHEHNIQALAFSPPDGRFLVSGSRDQTVQIWNPLTGERLIGAGTSGQITQLSFSPDGSRFASVGLYSSSGDVRQTDTGAALFTLEGHHTRLRSVAYSPNGEWLATGDRDGVVVLHDPADGQPLFSLASSTGEIYAIAFSPDESQMVISTSKGRIELWNLEERSFEGGWSNGSVVNGLTYSVDGSLVISGSNDATVRFWDAVSGKRLVTLNGHSGSVNGISLSRDGATLASAGNDGLVIVWRIQQ